MAQKITVYSTTNCAYCLMVKKWLTTKDIPFESINLDEQPELVEHVEDISGGRAVPVTVLEKDDKTTSVVVGFNLKKLTEMLVA